MKGIITIGRENWSSLWEEEGNPGWTGVVLELPGQAFQTRGISRGIMRN